MKEVEKLQEKFKELKVTNFNIFPGSKKVDVEVLAKEINQSISKIENGDFEIVEIED
jgi:translation elongation factor EF-1beta